MARVKQVLSGAAGVLLCSAATLAAPVQRTYKLPGVTALAVTGVNVTVTTGPNASLTLIGEPRDLARLKFAVENNELRLKPLNSDLTNWKSKLLKGIEVQVSLPKLATVSIAGAGSVTATGIAAKYFDVSVGGGGTFTGLDMQIGDAEVSVGNVGTITLSGTCKKASIGTGGGGTIKARDFTCAEIDVVTTNGGLVEAFASQTATTHIVSGGDVTIYGNPPKRPRGLVRGGTLTYAGE